MLEYIYEVTNQSMKKDEPGMDGPIQFCSQNLQFMIVTSAKYKEQNTDIKKFKQFITI